MNWEPSCKGRRCEDAPGPYDRNNSALRKIFEDGQGSGRNGAPCGWPQPFEIGGKPGENDEKEARVNGLAAEKGLLAGRVEFIVPRETGQN